jgi:hypothetical protein
MTDRKEFLRQTALFNAIGAAFQHALIYVDGSDNDAKEQFKHDLEEHLRRIETQYKGSVSSEKHLQTIADVVKGMSRKHTHILKDGRFRVGIAQKAVNIYLKLLWCYGWIPEPPHCPIDSIVLAEVRDRQTRWTKMDCIEEYRAAIERIQAYIRQTGAMTSLSKWELCVWNNRRKQGVQQKQSSRSLRSG